jgi:hypothetical protein
MEILDWSILVVLSMILCFVGFRLGKSVREAAEAWHEYSDAKKNYKAIKKDWSNDPDH